MGFFDSLFGGTEKISKWNGEQQDVMRLLASQIMGGLEGGVAGYDGRLTASLPKGLMGQITSLLRRSQPEVNGASQTDAILSMLSGKPSYDVSPKATTELFGKAVAAPMMEMFDKEIAPRIRESFASPGSSFNSRGGNAQAQALKSLETQLTSQLAQAQMQNQQLAASLAESAQNRRATGLGAANQQAMMPVQQAGAITQTALPITQLKQNSLSNAYSEWLRTQPQNNPMLSAAMSFLNQSPYAITNNPGLLSQVAGGVNNMLSLTTGLGALGGSGGAVQQAGNAMTQGINKVGSFF